MAFDAGMLYAVVHELNTCLSDGKVEKIAQPAKEEVSILFRHFGESHRLCIRVGSDAPRLSLTAQVKENPATPPMFCMLLRKHLGGAKLLSVTQEGYERVARLTFSGYDEMGYASQKHLIVEIMGKYSNLMLTDAADRVLAVLRPVDFTTSRRRQVLPGMTYELPPKQDKFPPLEETEAAFLARYARANPDTLCEKYLTATYLGTATQVARELAWQASGMTDATLGQCPPDKLWQAFSQWFRALADKQFCPTLALAPDGRVLDFLYNPVTYYGDAANTVSYPTFCALLDACFGAREQRERIRQRASDLWGITERTVARLTRKLEAQGAELAEAEEGQRYQRMGDLITANLWQLKRGDTELRAVDYYEEDQPERIIPLDGRMTPAANAQRYYKYYTKAKHAKEYLTEQMARSREELAYLETVRSFLEKAESEQDLVEIREELYRAGYASRMKGYAPPKQLKPRPIEYVTPDGGYRVLVGRNNIQNDVLTFRTAGKGDLWFHAKAVPGSHVLLLCDGAEPTARDYTFAATLAAIHSKAEGDMVAVDYTRVRYVKKPPQAKPGFVTYSTNYTAYVSADQRIIGD